jgi:prepilin-type N-terminal cleavage/methylation domain-containing protein
MNHRINKNKGFTLLELMFAMTFLSILLITIAMFVTQISSIYQRGITIRSINLVGRSMTTAMQKDIDNTSPFLLTDQSQGSQTRAKNRNYILFDGGGRLCVGNHSYIWNTVDAIQSNAMVNKYSGSNKTIRFVQVPDNSGTYCKQNSGKYPDISQDGSIEMLDEGDREMNIYNFSVSSNDADYDAVTNQRVYTIQFTIGSITNKEYGVISNNECRAPSDAQSDVDYCSINSFTITARAGNKLSSE